MSGSLRDYAFQISYGPADDRLRSFYLPALERSVRYDRSAGFFSSSALAIAAAGIARLIQNGGRMRLLVGAQLDEEDVAAIARGHELRALVEERLQAALWDPEDVLLRQRLEALAWMVAAGTLELRVVLPKGPDGLPLPASRAQDYYHTKEGIFTDAAGDQIAFSGSINESETGWLNNYEQFMVFPSWDATRPYLAQVRERFERLWEDREPDWIALPIPDAVRDRLIAFRPDQAPARDPIETGSTNHVLRDGRNGHGYDASASVEAIRSRLLIQFVRDAPYFPGARRLGAVTSAVAPWPHQHRVADAIVARFPERFLVADEVGLGKTIEAGLAIRQLVISGRVRRCLILTPKSVQRQWQEELYEKFALDVPRYDGETFWTVHGEERWPAADNPFDAEPILLVSSQLVKRQDRRDVLLAAQPWDLVVVDEAHHARRKDFLAVGFRPNRLLELLLALKERTRGLLLLTATPMQVHPVEVWDLLRLLGMGGRWGADSEEFQRFFAELSKDFADIDWDLVFDLVADFLATGGTEDGLLAAMARERLGLVTWEQIRSLPSSSRRKQIIAQLPPEARPFVIEFAKRHTPLRRFVFRNTRALLHDYRQRGLLADNIARRTAHPIWIEMLPAERELYDRIEEYIAHFYEKYEAERKGLGFIMTVYRRRLTSSFAAIEASLKRRLDFLLGLSGDLGLVDDDLEEDDLELDVSEALAGDLALISQEEVNYVEDFLRQIRQLSCDSKFNQLLDDLRAIFTEWETVVIFTQYTDTMDDLRERLREIYGSQVACYSGRGGERWRNGAWERTTKEEIKQAFRQGEEIKILLCTEAASEGLNLQTCGVLINYDMPWNPMRVEQRIGRIDRIGQRYETVWVRNYFYEGTIEATVYERLEDRIDWFQNVVGHLQPILSGVARSIQKLAMLPPARRRQALEAELSSLRAQLDSQQKMAIHLDEFLESGDPEHVPTPLTLVDLERLLTRESELRERFRPHAEIPGAYVLSFGDRLIPVTFDPKVFDEHPSAVRLLTYGDALFAALLGFVEGPQADERQGLLRCASDGAVPKRAYFVLGERSPVARLAELERAIADGGRREWTAEERFAAEDEFRRIVQADLDAEQAVASARRAAERRRLFERGRQVLLKAAMVENALAQQPGIFGEEALRPAFSEEAVRRLRRHGHPFKSLFALVQREGIGGAALTPSPTDPYWQQIQGLAPAILRKRLTDLGTESADIVQKLAAPSPIAEGPQTLDITSAYLKVAKHTTATPETAVPTFGKQASPQTREQETSPYGW